MALEHDRKDFGGDCFCIEIHCHTPSRWGRPGCPLINQANFIFTLVNQRKVILLELSQQLISHHHTTYQIKSQQYKPYNKKGVNSPSLIIKSD